MQRNTKEWIQYGSAIFLLASGVAMAFLSFFFNGGDVKDSVLWYVSQTLVYAAQSSVWVSTFRVNGEM